MSRGGRRAGAGAPAGNVNALRHGLYSRRLRDREQLGRFFDALAIEGLDEEIALLRVKVAVAAGQDLEAMLATLAVLIRALVVNKRVSRRSYDDVFEATVAVLEGIGSTLGLEV